MTEEEWENWRKQDYLLSRVVALEQTVRIMFACMSKDQQDFIQVAGAELARKAADHAAAVDTDPARTLAEAAWDANDSLVEALEDWADQYREKLSP